MCGDGMYTFFIKQCGEEELAADSRHTHSGIEETLGNTFVSS